MVRRLAPPGKTGYDALMPQRFDATLKQLVQAHPRDWLAVLHVPAAEPVEVLTPDLSTVTRFADAVLRVGDHGIVHIDFQSGPDPALPRRMLLYNALLHEAYAVPVHTVVVLLRPKAGAGLRGTVNYQLVPRRGRLAFRFEVVRVWQRPAEEWLTGELGLVPLAPLGRLPAGTRPATELRGVVDRLLDRIRHEAPPSEVAAYEAASYILTGLRVPQSVVTDLFRGVREMRESSAYQAILEEGREEGALRTARAMLLRQGRVRFKATGPDVEAAVQAINDLPRLERMGERLVTAGSWQEVLATP
jgi:predicted transposase YdaD